MPTLNVRGACPAGNPGSGWNDERVELLKTLWADGLSASQIASKIGSFTRNAVIGKVHRLGLAGRATTSRVRTARPRTTAGLFPARPARPTGSRSRQPARVIPRVIRLRALPDLGPAPDGVIGIAELQDDMCRWPVGDPMEQGFHFCGRHKSAGVPYCEHHAASAYN